VAKKRYSSEQIIVKLREAEVLESKGKGQLNHLNVGPLFIETGIPWENGYNESFNRKLRDELFNGEVFYTLKEAQIIIER